MGSFGHVCNVMFCLHSLESVKTNFNILLQIPVDEKKGILWLVLFVCGECFIKIYFFTSLVVVPYPVPISHSSFLLTTCGALLLLSYATPARCTEPPLTGGCRHSNTKWYYNPVIQDCARFNFGGCGGNDNRFDSKENCMTMCRGVTGGSVGYHYNVPTTGSSVTHVHTPVSPLLIGPACAECRDTGF